MDYDFTIPTYLQYQAKQTSVPSAGGSSMAPVIIPAAISAASSLGGAAMGGKAAKDAAASQERSAAQALKFAREQEATRQQNFNRAYDIWNASRQALLDRYGITLPAASAGPTSVGGARPLAGSMSPKGTGVSFGLYGTPQNFTLGELLATKNKDEDPYAFPTV